MESVPSKVGSWRGIEASGCDRARLIFADGLNQEKKLPNAK